MKQSRPKHKQLLALSFTMGGFDFVGLDNECAAATSLRSEKCKKLPIWHGVSLKACQEGDPVD